MPIVKYCAFCGAKIIRSAANFHSHNEHYFCNSHCDAMFKRKVADAKHFKRVKQFDKVFEKHKRQVLYAIKCMREYIFSYDDVEDFIQVCRIELWRLYSDSYWKDIKGSEGAFIITSCINALKRYISEIGRKAHHYLNIDPVYFANPESVAYYRECLKALDSTLYKELLAQALSSKNNKELAEEFGTSENAFINRCFKQRERLRNLLTEWE